MSVQLFAIKHLPTGHYLPAPRGRNGRGGSHVEPVEVTAATPPRLFHTESAAKIALTTWLQGRVTVTHFQDSYTGEYDESLHVEKVPSRRREEMAVVPVELLLDSEVTTK